MPKRAKQSENQRVEQLQKVIEEAQRQPGLDEVLKLVDQSNCAQRAAEECKPGQTYVAGATVGETPSAVFAVG